MDQPKSRFSVAKCRQILGKKYDNCTDEQIIKIRDFIYMLVQMDMKHMKEQEESSNQKNHVNPTPKPTRIKKKNSFVYQKVNLGKSDPSIRQVG